MLSATKSLFSNEVFGHGLAAVKEYPFSLRRTLLALAVGLLAVGLLATFKPGLRGRPGRRSHRRRLR